MSWVTWGRKSADALSGRGPLGLDWNSGRVRAVYGKATKNKVFLLDDPHTDLPLGISLEKRTPEVGRAALRSARKLPHAICADYLPALGQSTEWKHGKTVLNVDAALSLALERLKAVTTGHEGFALALPSYLSVPQVTRFCLLAERAKVKIRGTASAPLALAAERATHFLYGQREEAPPETPKNNRAIQPTNVVVIDIDEHALTASVVRISESEVRSLASASYPRLGTRWWRERLLDAMADRCVRLCRRDPRDNADAEQMLFEQLDEAIDRARTGQRVSLSVRTAHWFQDLILSPADLDAVCSTLCRQVSEEVRNLLVTANDAEPPRAAWLTHDVGRLPGLATALHQNLTDRTSVRVLHPEATATAVANFIERWEVNQLPRTHLDTAIVLPPRPDSRLLPRAPQRQPEAR